MSKVYDAVMRAQRLRGAGDELRSLRDRLRRWIPRTPDAPTQPQPADGSTRLPEATELHEQEPRDLEGRIASLQVAVDSLDDRLSAEVVEREAKLLEELRRGMRGLETELSDRFAAATLEMKRTTQRGVALLVSFIALLAGLVVGALSLI